MRQKPFSCFDWFDFNLVEVDPGAIDHSHPILSHDFCIFLRYNFSRFWGQHNTLELLCQWDCLQESVAFKNHTRAFLRITLIEVPHSQWHLLLEIFLLTRVWTAIAIITVRAVLHLALINIVRVKAAIRVLLFLDWHGWGLLSVEFMFVLSFVLVFLSWHILIFY